MKSLSLAGLLMVGLTAAAPAQAQDDPRLSRIRQILRSRTGSGTAAPAAPSATTSSSGPAAPGSSLEGRRYTLGPGDRLSVYVFTRDRRREDEDDGPLEVPVTASGHVTLPLVGRLAATGDTTEGLERKIYERYKEFVKDPQVSVSVSAYRAKRVYVIGQVRADGEIFLNHDSTSLFEVIARAGGFVDSFGSPLEGADVHNIVVRRGGQRIHIDFYGNEVGDQAAKTFLVQDGDFVFVPKPLRRVRVLGGVQKAGEFELKPGMSLLDAIAQAGSFTVRSRRDQVRILRSDGETLHADATRIFHGKTEDIPLEPGDVIYVSEW